MIENTEVEVCVNCGEKIGRLERAYLWKEQIICLKCNAKLTSSVIVGPAVQRTTSPPLRAGNHRRPVIVVAAVALVILTLLLFRWMFGVPVVPHVGDVRYENYRSRTTPLMTAAAKVLADVDSDVPRDVLLSDVTQMNALYAEWKGGVEAMSGRPQSSYTVAVVVSSLDYLNALIRGADGSRRRYRDAYIAGGVTMTTVSEAMGEYENDIRTEKKKAEEALERARSLLRDGD